MVGPTGITVVYGAIAQLVEHLHGMQGVSGSNPLGSTRESQVNPGFFVPGGFLHTSAIASSCKLVRFCTTFCTWVDPLHRAGA